MEISKIRTLFPIYKKYHDLCYFDSAASSLKLKSVTAALSDYYQYNGVNVHRGVYKLASLATQGYEDTRNSVANFINAEYEEIIFTKGTSHSLNMLVNSLKKQLKENDEVISSQLEHHSQILPWIIACRETKAILKFIPLDGEHRISVANFKKVLTSKTKVVALTHVANTMGYLTPIEEITKLAHQVNAIVILDAAQSVAHQKIDVKKLDVDYLAFSAHKMYGPNGVGILYGKKELLDKLEPSEYGGEMVYKLDDVNPLWKDSPYKFETGTPAIAEVIAFAKAIEFLNKTNLDKIYQHEHILHQYTLEKMLKIKGLTVYNKSAEAPIILFNIDSIHPHDAASLLDQENIALRAGHHCAQHVIAFLDQIATLRISFGVYNTIEDCDNLVTALTNTIEFFNTF